MRYEWIQQFDWKIELGSFIGTIDYLIESSSNVLYDIRSRHQWSNIKNVIGSSLHKRNIASGGGRSIERFKYVTKGLRRKGYTGRPREATYSTDKMVPSHNSEIDHAILASYSTTSPEAVKEMKIFIENGVKTSMITGTTLQTLKERIKEKNKKSAWDDFKKQKNWEKRVIYLTQREGEEKEELAKLNTEFESKLGLFSIGFLNTMGVYHDRYDIYPGRYKVSETIPLIRISSTIESWLYYCQHHLIKTFHKYQDKIIDLVQAIRDTKEVRDVSPQYNSIEGNCLKIGLGNCGYNEKGKSVGSITSEDYGSKGSSGLKSDTVLIVNAVRGTEVFAHQIIKEAKKKRVQHRFYVGNPNSDIAKYATKVIPINWSVHGYNGVIALAYPATGILFDGVISQLCEELDLTEDNLRKGHSQHH